MKKFLAVLFTVMICVLSPLWESTAWSNDNLENYLNQISEYQMREKKNPGYNSAGGEWTIVGLARYGTISERYAKCYRDNLKKYLQDNEGVLLIKKSTEYARVAIALTSIGEKADDFYGYNLLEPLAAMENVQKQGINGVIYALIALDCGDYEIPKTKTGTQVTREKLIETIVGKQMKNGGWNYNSETADTDMTAMAVQALAPYYHEQERVKKAVDLGMALLSEMQTSDGSYENSDISNCESTAQVLVAMSSMGIRYDDVRFVKEGNTVVDGLLKFYNGNGSFSHVKGEKESAMSTDQAMYALTACYRNHNGKNRLFDMRDAIRPIGQEKNNQFVIYVIVMVVIAAAGLVVFKMVRGLQ